MKYIFILFFSCVLFFNSYCQKVTFKDLIGNWKFTETIDLNWSFQKNNILTERNKIIYTTYYYKLDTLNGSDVIILLPKGKGNSQMIYYAITRFTKNEIDFRKYKSMVYSEESKNWKEFDYSRHAVIMHLKRNQKIKK